MEEFVSGNYTAVQYTHRSPLLICCPLKSAGLANVPILGHQGVCSRSMGICGEARGVTEWVCCRGGGLGREALKA